MIIPRDSLRKAFVDFACSGHGVVLGHPGAGKTHTISEFCRDLIDTGKPCLYVPIDKLGIETVAELSQSLGIPEDIPAYLARERGGSTGEPGFVVVDGFDAARSDRTQRQLLGLIQQIVNELSDTWHIIVSVRTYDAMRSADLLRLFPMKEEASAPPQDYRLANVACRHFHIPLLTDEEVEAAAQAIKGLPGVLENASDEFSALTRTPFNIWLLEELLLDSSLMDELTAVRSEIELLSMFWRERVNKGPHGESRSMLAASIAEKMVEEHSLSVRKDQVFESTQETAWHELLSENVLDEVGWQKQRIGFSHNILFDYAVCALLIEDTPKDFELFLSQDPSRPLFLRPSLNYFFTRLWYIQPDSFWAILWHILPSDIVHMRLFARLLPMAVVAQEFRCSEELRPLFEYRAQNRTQGDEAILRLLQALKGLNIQRDEVWSPILHEFSNDLSPDIVGELTTCLSSIFDRAKKEGNQTLITLCGQTARNILNWVWKQRGEPEGERFERLGSRWIVPIVAQSYFTAPKESRRALEPILEIVREKGFPIDFLYRLTHELEHIVKLDPDFVGLIYIAVFDNTETSDEKTEMGSPTLPMSSTRKQDYRMCYYNLKEQFPSFLLLAPEVASVTAIRCLTSFIEHTHLAPCLQGEVETSDLVEKFTFRGKEARFLADRSYIWGETKYPDDPLIIGSTLFEHLAVAAKNPAKAGLVDRTLDIFRDYAAAAFFWSSLLEVGAKNPARFSDELYELCEAFPVQVGNDSIHQLASFVEAAAPFYSSEQLKVLEELFVSLPMKADESHSRELLEVRRNRLISRIPREQLQTAEAQKIMTDLEAQKRVPSNEPLVRFEGGWKPYEEKDWLKEQGADWEKEANVRLHAFFAPLDDFSSEWSNKKPELEAVVKIATTLQGAHSLLHEQHGADPPVESALWTKVGECAETMAKASGEPTSVEFQLCRQILLECSRHPEPTPDPEYDGKYEQASWSPAPRNEAAQGLPWIAVWTSEDSEVISAIEALVDDPTPSVRYLVTNQLYRLNRYYKHQFWRLANRVAERETNKVVQQALCHSLTYVISKEEEKTCGILKRIASAALDTEDEAQLLDTLVNMVVWLCVARENQWALGIADKILADPLRYPNALSKATLDALSYVTPTNLKHPEGRTHATRARDWLSRAIDSAAGALKQYQNLSPEEINDDAQATLHEIYGVIHEVVTRFYFSAGLFEDSKNKPNITYDERDAFYHFIRPLLEQLISVSDQKQGGMFFAPTAHHFMELLNGLLPHDPRNVLHLAYRVASISRDGNYSFDSMAVREVVKLVESVLATHRFHIRDDESLSDLLGLLDVFAEVGWPDALRLVWRLDEVFR